MNLYLNHDQTLLDLDGILKGYATNLITTSPDELILDGKDWIRTLVTELHNSYEFYKDFKFIDIRIIERHVIGSYISSQKTSIDWWSTECTNWER